jgi:hypothetical protein
VLGPAVLASCTSDAGVTTSVSTQATGSTGSTSATTQQTQPTGTGGTAEAIVWRLSTRNQRAPCKACKAHAAHKYFASHQVATAARAHPGCTCDVLEQPTTATQYEAWFTTTGSEVFDDRRKV